MKFLKLVLFLFSVFVWSQDQHEIQQWKKIHSPFVNVIYKKGQKQDALKIVNTIAYIQKNNAKSIGYHFKPIDIILRANTVDSNGFVTYSPFRSEFFNSAPPTFYNLGTTDWLNTLAIHEYRHVQQFLNHKAGFTNFLYYLIGQRGWAIGSIVAVPDWYFEGDAVTMETALTKSGRGRLPKFTALQRSLYKQKKIYSYQKIRNGSYKNLVPGAYATGYQILNYYRNNFDASRLDDIARNATSFYFPFYGFSHYMKKETGLTTTKLYQKSVKESIKNYQQQQQKLNTISYQSFTKNQHKNTKIYAFPQVFENNDLIVLKKTLDRISAFYCIDSLGKETKITAAISNNDDYFDYKNKELVFCGLKYNPRYTASNYHDIYVYDIDTKIKKRITYKKRYFSPSFNSDNSKIIAISNNQNTYKLVILDRKNGTVLKSIDIDGVASRPKFIDPDTFVYIFHKNHQLAIFKTTKSGKKTQLTPWTSHSIDDIRINKNKVYYSASFNGIDNIYQSPLDGSLEISQITNASIGAYQPFIKNNVLYFIETTTLGNKISFTSVKSNNYVVKEPILMNWNNHKSVVFEKGNILDKIPQNNYQASTYSSVFDGLKIHDWEYSVTNELISATATATNLLNNFSFTALANIYRNENNSFKASVIASYSKWFPVFNLETTYLQRDFKSTFNNLKVVEKYTDVIITPSISIPLFQINGNYSNSLNFLTGYEYHKTSNRTLTFKNNGKVSPIKDARLGLINLQLAISSIKNKAYQNINTPAGFFTHITYNIAADGFLKGNFIKATTHLFFPGILKSHNSFLSIAYQNNQIHNGTSYQNIYSDSFSYARGYTALPSKKVGKLSYTYQLPVFYPDYGLWGITYFKRIRANIFADFSRVKLYSRKTTSQNSIGFELIFDNTILNIGQAEFGFGYRGSYLLNKDITKPNRQFLNGFFISTNLF